MMRGYLVFIMLLLFLVKSQNNKADFINLDCGLRRQASPYLEEFKKLTYMTDEEFTQSKGRTGEIDTTMKTNRRKPLWSLRSFPNGRRNCYNIQVERESTYLIRAAFVYGNYDKQNSVPIFDLYVSTDIWTRVVADDTINEVIHFTKHQLLHICLVNIGKGVPFINVLEVRPIPNPKAYKNPSGSLKLLFRWYFNKSRISKIRYPDDIYDRYWYPYFLENLWLPVTTNPSMINSTDHDGYNPPQRVMAAAAIPRDANGTLDIEWSVKPPTAQFYPYIYVSELETLGGNDIREFNMMLNGDHLYGPLLPEQLDTKTVYSLLPLQDTNGDGKCVLRLEKTARSTLPPILSAIEVYTVMELSQLETNEDDVTGIKDVQGSYNLSRITWQGDPCAPVQFMWQGLKCSHSDNSTSLTIISLDLSSSGLTGSIAEAIQSLPHLQQLDLSNNSLSGQVPEFLAYMKSLLLINLSGNDLSGSVPLMLAGKRSEVKC